jgi:hypothetical protein
MFFFRRIGDVDKTTENGGVAQLGARLNGIQKVRGSIPLVSTIKKNNHKDRPCGFLLLYRKLGKKS